MKTIGIYFSAMLLMVVLSGYSFAQQDYQVVQNFKAKQQQLRDDIKSAQSLDDLNSLQAQIDQFKSDYYANKDLLDKSLYPDDMTTSIDKLSNALETRRGDFTQISTLKVQVTQIQSQLDSLNSKNADLLSQIEQMKESNGKDMAKLSQTIAELKSSLAKRDKIIMAMLSGMIPSSNNANGNLTGKERQELYSQTKKEGIITNLKKAINDNVQFLSVTSLSPEDLNSMKKQQNEFVNIWNNVGPEIVSVYSAKKENTKNINSIDSSLAAWNSSMDQAAWSSIRQAFNAKGITLSEFTNGNEFTQLINSYIDNEIKNADANSTDSKNMYRVFVDSVWTNDMRQAWIPFLVKNKMISSYDNDRMEAKIEAWKNVISPNNFTWLYIISALLVLIILYSLISVIMRSRKNKEQGKMAEAKYHHS